MKHFNFIHHIYASSDCSKDMPAYMAGTFMTTDLATQDKSN
ncbi:hypothetical protein ACFFUS_20725 [Vibrio gallaecicus]|uniref:Uncharacterized protein n=1 Tax=Vibrio gallaecicus TaxID=552386 RepID=A0ABV4N698_9VIBR|nr:hypothetical protein [Vibrio gallaecicus]MDN3614122.1 hypothetical protein [Vibrio gallaecicus]